LALSPQGVVINADLAAILEAWPCLSNKVSKRIAILIRTDSENV